MRYKYSKRLPDSMDLGRRNVLCAAGALVSTAGALFLNQPVQAQNTRPARGPLVWLNMDQAELDAAYDQSVYASNMEEILRRNEVKSQATLERLGEPQRYIYGPAPNETLDVYRSTRPDAPINIFIHGGAWRAGTARANAYLAETFVHSGSHFVIPDFSWVQDVSGDLSVLGSQVRRAVAWVYQNADRFSGDANRIYVSGHSAGGHLAGVVLTTDWLGDFGLSADLVKGGLCISGMFDLEPVRLSDRSSYVEFTDEIEQSLSPQRHIDKIMAPLIVAYGTLETPEFQRQSRNFASAVEAAGKRVQLIVGDGYNHFEILETLANPFGFLGNVVREQMRLTRLS